MAAGKSFQREEQSDTRDSKSRKLRVSQQHRVKQHSGGGGVQCVVGAAWAGLCDGAEWAGLCKSHQFHVEHRLGL